MNTTSGEELTIRNWWFSLKISFMSNLCILFFFFRLVEEASSGKYLHSNDTPPCPPRPPLYAPQDVVSERTLKVDLWYLKRDFSYSLDA